MLAVRNPRGTSFACEALAGLPYPTREELKEFGDAMRNIFETVEEQETENGNVALFRKKDKKTSFSERSGVIPGYSSSKRLLQAGNGHLSTNSLTSQEDVAKLIKNTQNTIRSANKKINEGGLNNLGTVENAVRKVSEALKLIKYCA